MGKSRQDRGLSLSVTPDRASHYLAAIITLLERLPDYTRKQILRALLSYFEK